MRFQINNFTYEKIKTKYNFVLILCYFNGVR